MNPAADDAVEEVEARMLAIGLWLNDHELPLNRAMAIAMLLSGVRLLRACDPGGSVIDLLPLVRAVLEDPAPGAPIIGVPGRLH